MRAPKHNEARFNGDEGERLNEEFLSSSIHKFSGSHRRELEGSDLDVCSHKDLVAKRRMKV